MSTGINSLHKDSRVQVDSLEINQVGTATGSAGASTCNTQAGQITTESLTTAAVTDYTHTLTNSYIKANSIVMASLDNGTNTTAPIYVSLVTVTNGQAVIKVRNGHATVALNGTIKINFFVVNDLY